MRSTPSKKASPKTIHNAVLETRNREIASGIARFTRRGYSRLNHQTTNRMYFGADYHPEHWIYPFAGTPEQPEGRWERDAELMAQAGFNVVRMGEFTWGLCEREEGKYDFDWLRRVMDIMQRRGIQVVLATPTAAPPLWLARQHPDI